jgi:formylglycine-generating enzyme required for sulfatase activity
MSLRAAALDDPVSIRHADRDLLSLALIDARNLTLRWLEVFERRGLHADTGAGRSVLWLCGHAGWYQEWWLARHVQRQRGEHCDPGAPRLASIEPRADHWFTSDGGQPDDADAVRRYLADTLETTLELLAAADEGDAALHFHRAALLHEDRLGECLAERAALLRLARQPDPVPPLVAAPSRPAREPVWMPAARLQLGSTPGGFVPDNERWAETLALPEYEIDAQVVTWERYVEFAEDGGYDRRELWSDAGWGWVQDSARRAPRDVEQMRGGVLLHRAGELQRAPAGQAAVHVTRHEAEAWCRWAGRRLPTEPEWEMAALAAAKRGFVWGDVFEWTGGSARGWNGHAETPGSLDRLPPPRTQGVLRGASAATLRRWHHPKARRFVLPASDLPFNGFRSCAF